MKVGSRATREDHVRIGKDIAEDEAFRRYLELSRDSYPMGLGRLTAICLHVLQYDRRIYTRFQLDRAVQWPADRKLGFGQVLELVGWAKARSATLVELDLPLILKPSKPYREKHTFRSSVHGRDENGQFIGKDEVESRLMTRHGRPVTLITMDGEPRNGVESLITEESKQITIRRSRHGSGPIQRVVKPSEPESGTAASPLLAQCSGQSEAPPPAPRKPK